MVHIYEIMKNYFDGQPKLLHNWMFEPEQMGMDKGKPFTLMGWDAKEGKEKPLMDLRLHGVIEGVTVDELLTEMEKGREHGTAFLKSHGIAVPEHTPTDEKKKYIRARPKGESQWVYDNPNNREHYKDEDGVEWEIEEVMITQDDFENMPEFTGW